MWNIIRQGKVVIPSFYQPASTAQLWVHSAGRFQNHFASAYMSTWQATDTLNVL